MNEIETQRECINNIEECTRTNVNQTIDHEEREVLNKSKLADCRKELGKTKRHNNTSVEQEQYLTISSNGKNLDGSE